MSGCPGQAQQSWRAGRQRAFISVVVHNGIIAAFSRMPLPQLSGCSPRPAERDEQNCSGHGRFTPD